MSDKFQEQDNIATSDHEQESTDTKDEEASDIAATSKIANLINYALNC